MKNIKLIIFDLDGTLVDAYPAIISSFNYTMRLFRYSQQDSVTIRRAVGWGDENLLKPHPEILEKLITRFSLKPKQALYVGDMSIDAQAGRRAKVKTIIVRTGSSNAEEIEREKPYRIIDSLGELACSF